MASRPTIAPRLSGVQSSKHRFHGHRSFAALYHNSRSFSAKLDVAIAKVEEMMDAGAFLHHFHRFGVSKDDFDDGLLRLFHLSRSYKSE